MKVIQIFQIRTQITKIIKKYRIPCENLVNHENLKIPNDINENHENHTIQLEDHKQH